MARWPIDRDVAGARSLLGMTRRLNGSTTARLQRDRAVATYLSGGIGSAAPFRNIEEAPRRRVSGTSRRDKTGCGALRRRRGTPRRG
jgi:hypothetical protein